MKKKRINWKQIEKDREYGVTWKEISEYTGITMNTLLMERRKRKMFIGKPGESRKGQKQCKFCEHMFAPENIKRISKGKICRRCYEKMKGVS